jgi:hypothetical protein
MQIEQIKIILYYNPRSLLKQHGSTIKLMLAPLTALALVTFRKHATHLHGPYRTLNLAFYMLKNVILKYCTFIFVFLHHVLL